jgi:hypothetical protein
MIYPILQTLSKEAVRQLLLPFLAGGAQLGSSLWTDHKTRLAAAKHAEAAEAVRKIAAKLEVDIPKILDNIESREVRIIKNAFNSSAAYTNGFMRAAIVTTFIEVGAGVAALRNIGIQLEGIKETLDKQTLAMVGGYGTEGFGKFVYNFVRSEIAAHKSRRGVFAPCHRTRLEKHVFYVYNPDTVWVPVFEAWQRKKSLGRCFGGYSSDLQAIFLLMWTNRQTLVETREDGADIVFHLLVPGDYFYAINQPFIIHPDLSPLVIKGHSYKSKNLFWFNFEVPPGVTMEKVGNIRDIPKSTPVENQVAIGAWAGTFVAGVVAAACPPLAPVAGAAFIGSWCTCAGAAGISIGRHILSNWTASPTPVLGPPLLHHPGRS